MTRRIRSLFLPLACAAALGAGAAPARTGPTGFGPVLADSHRSAENRALDADRLPAEVLDFAGIRRGDIVADFQAGGGYYSELLSGVVGPRGRVYALESADYVKPAIWSALTAAHTNVSLLAAPANALQLAPSSVDVIFAHLVFHDLYLGTTRSGEPLREPAAVLANWFAGLKPGGHVIVADHVGLAGDPGETARALHRIDPEVVKAAMASAGFVLESESSVLHRSDDAHVLRVFDPSLRGRTDRFLMKFKKS